MPYQEFGRFNGSSTITRFKKLYATDFELSFEMTLSGRALIRSLNFETGVAGFRLLYDGTAEFNDLTARGSVTTNLLSIYDGATLVGYMGWEPTGYGADTLIISTEVNLDPIVISAAGFIHLTAPGDGGVSVKVSGDGDGAIPGRVLYVTNEAETVDHFSVWSNGEVHVEAGHLELHAAANKLQGYEADGTTLNWEIGNVTGSDNLIIDVESTNGSMYLRTNVSGTVRDRYQVSFEYHRWFNTSAVERVRLDDNNFFGSVGTGAFLLRIDAVGTAASPAYSFNGDTDTGIYRSAANTLNFSCGNSQVLQLQQGKAKFNDGSAAAPSLTFINDTDTGFKRVTGDSIGVVAGGQDMFRMREVSSVHYFDFTDAGELWWYNDGSYTASGRRYRWWVDSADFDSFKLNVSSSAGAWSTEMRFVDGRMYLPATQGYTTGTAANLHITTTSGVLTRSTSARKYKSRITYNVDYLADIKLAPAKFYRKDDSRWFYGFIADDLGDQDRLLGEYDEDEIENFDTRAVMAVMAAKINRLEARLDAAA